MRQGNSLDFHYLLWDFLVTGVDQKEMEILKLTDAEQYNPQSNKNAKQKTDNNKEEIENQSDDEDEQVPLSELKKMKNMQATCCILF